MRALTVQQPWAWAIVHGGKDVENRTQAWSYRGPLAIHAGARFSDRSNDALVEALRTSMEGGQWRALEFGAFVGLVELIDVHLETPRCCASSWAERVSRYDDHPIRHLVLENPRPLPVPIPCRGQLGLWTPPADILEQLQEALP